MPLATIHLLALAPPTTPYAYLSLLSSSNIHPLIASRPIRWIIRPEHLSTHALLDTTWDLLLILPTSTPLPPHFTSKSHTRAHWSITAGIPSSLLTNFPDKNATFLHPPAGSVPQLTGSLSQPRKADSTQGLELNDELLTWSQSFDLGDGAVSMLNLLKFNEGESHHKNYQKYGQEFARSIGSRRGGVAKIVGRVVQGDGSEDREGWDEVALAHYPSIHHFVDMLASEDYQAVNHQYRLPSLRDTCILCTSELSPEVDVREGRGKARL